MPLPKFILYYLKIDDRTVTVKKKEKIFFRTGQCLAPTWKWCIGRRLGVKKPGKNPRKNLAKSIDKDYNM